MIDGYSDLTLLTPQHDVSEFRCASTQQTRWLRVHGHANRKPGTMAKTYVVTEPQSSEVIAYFAWCMSAVATDTLPIRYQQGSGNYPVQPLLLLARFGVHSDHEGNGIGSAMFTHVTEQTYELSKVIGCRGLLIHAETTAAVEFYRRRFSEIDNITGNPRHLLIFAKDIVTSQNA